MKQVRPSPVILVLGLALLLSVACFDQLPLIEAEERGDGAVVVSIRRLADYPSVFTQARLIETETDETVWHVQRESGDPQLWEFVFRPGKNPTIPVGLTTGTLEVLVPEKEPQFLLAKGSQYRLELRGSRNELRRAEFAL